MLARFFINEKTRMINRILAWVLLILLVLIFVSGYALIGKINFIPGAIAINLHNKLMLVTIILFVFHALTGSFLLSYQRKAKKPI